MHVCWHYLQTALWNQHAEAINQELIKEHEERILIVRSKINKPLPNIHEREHIRGSDNKASRRIPSFTPLTEH